RQRCASCCAEGSVAVVRLPPDNGQRAARRRRGRDRRSVAGRRAGAAVGGGSVSRPYGSWPSPITAALLVEQAVGLGQVESDGERVWWLEGRPAEAGRQVVVTWAPDVGERGVIPEC